ncbi:hypothetical protein PU629_01410 [Pullulanibacillus sp. KACC 23026]|uniref:hypothetical protein n=1 Tax=Pullulanibacillus sp. KACC 23026 TaxID=3028315 RepID=UPI0023AEFBE8|nr:hypothetical protein [Pullulanibacillus sp. KACC 23026]WEG13044.1 hypothetical protein PU629_01410 [Pullulanibacillus sp. KACC 23026]
MKKHEDEPTLAPGIDTEDELNDEATEEEIEEGDTTTVTRLVLDENDPSGED